MAKQPKQNRESGEDAEHELVALARGLAEIASSHGLSELIVDTKETTLTIRRGGTYVAAQVAASAPMASAPVMHAPAAFAAAPAPIAAAPAAVADDKAHVVTSPFVGTFYRKPNPDSPSYVSLNDKIDKGQVLCIVEAMKLMNEIEADVAGTVVGILVEDGMAVEYGQPLFKITV
ncbi:MAG TPA: acetyl-CoA carboxylase biotin carboxyl carrier protein [Kofleriaceae bacterium]|jgi:acetyl-CoA carboxylase biotin carboxyl carrier protein